MNPADRSDQTPAAASADPQGEPSQSASQAVRDAEAEVGELLAGLIRIDTSNPGDGSGPGEIAAADHALGLLQDAGYDPELFHTTSDSRAGLALRIPGANPSRPALLLHGHLDVVPAPVEGWEVPPFSGEVAESHGEPMIWGRGAVDMKDTDSILLALLRGYARHQVQLDRDVVLLLTPDEEAGGWDGAHWLVDNRPDLFEGVTEAVGEVGGFSFTTPSGRRAYLVEAAQKGIAWLELTARSSAGHGSLIHHDTAIGRLSAAVARIAEHTFPVQVDPSMEPLLNEFAEQLGVPWDPERPELLLQRLGLLGAVIGATLRNTANPTMLGAGVKVNVVPGVATAAVDTRYLPGRRDELLATIRELAGPGVEVETSFEDRSVSTDFTGDLVESMNAAVMAEDPGALVLPYLMPGGTDAKAFSELDIRCFGFTPLRLPEGLDFWGMFHNVNERVPVSSLQFGVRAMDRFLRSS